MSKAKKQDVFWSYPRFLFTGANVNMSFSQGEDSVPMPGILLWSAHGDVFCLLF